MACPFHSITGIPCPGCGSTRAFLSLLRGDIPGAIAWNPLFILGGGFFATYILVGLLMYFRTGHFPDPKFNAQGLNLFRALVICSVVLNWIYLVRSGV